MPAAPPSVLLWILSFAALGCVLSLAGGAAYLMLPQHLRERSLSHFISFATGTLLGVTFIELLPHALELKPAAPEPVLLTVLGGILVFFVLEKALIWRHAHHHESDQHTHHGGLGHTLHAEGGASAGALIMVGDTFHNFLDGVLLTAVFVTDLQLGIVTGVAMIAHEIPQELGDFAIMLKSGFSRTRTFTLNAVSSLAMVVGALLAWWWRDTITAYLPYVLAFTSASFIYIAVADLIPSLHRGIRLRESLAQLTLIAAGIALVLCFGHD